MPVALMSMPWSDHTRPSAALGALGAFVRRERPRIEIRPHSEYVPVASALGFPLYELLAMRAYKLGELLYMVSLYPERSDAVRARFLADAPRRDEGGGLAGLGPFASWDEVFDHIRATLESHLSDVVTRIAGRFEVVGLTTCFGQLFANLALCRRLKAVSPETITVLGGSTVSSRVGSSLLQEYPFVDVVIQGEGERPLVALLDAIRDGRPWSEIPGVLGRPPVGSLPPAARLWEVDRLADLPVPDYDEYAERADEHGIDWLIPIEGSRGCWWDRAKRTGDPRNTCYFCNLNVQWSGYREKPARRVVRELKALADRYGNTRVFFLDNIIRHHGVPELARGIATLGKHFDIFYECRASIRPHELLAMWEAGLTGVQFGIEALSTAVLRRIGKGTSVIQNLQVMKICAELGIENLANLIIRFPGSTRDEVDETCRNILRYALPYNPCTPVPFTLGTDSTVDVLRAQFGIENVRNRDVFRAGLPDDTWRRLALLDLDYDDASGTADWSPVEAAVARWRERQAEVKEPLLVYYDGGTFLTIVDRRQDYKIVRLRGLLRALYLYCMQIRSRAEILARFSASAERTAIEDGLARLAAHDAIFEEGGRYLSLALASHPRLAATRIRADAPGSRGPTSRRRGPRRGQRAAARSGSRQPRPRAEWRPSADPGHTVASTRMEGQP